MRRSAIVLALALFLFASEASAQTAVDLYHFGRRTPAVGARLTAMGGAAVAGLGDWTAAYANPAGLAYLQSSQAVASGHAFVQDAEGFGNQREGLTLGAVGYAMPLPVLRGALVFGGGYRETAVYARPLEGASGWQGEASLEGAVALAPRLVGGLAINAPLGHYSTNAYAVATGDGYDVVATEAMLYGVNVRGGLSLALDHGIRLGLAVETPTYLRVEHEPRVRATDVVHPYDVAMTTPWRFALGFLAGGPGVLVSADVEIVDWSQARFDADGDPELLRENAFAGAAYRTVLNARVGAEGQLGPVALRVGAAFQPDPRFDGPTPERLRQTYAAGIGVRVRPEARLDVALVHTRDEAFVRFSPFPDAVRNAVQVGLDVRF